MDDGGAEVLFWVFTLVCGFVLGCMAGSEHTRNKLTRQIADGEVRVEKHTFGDGRTEYRIVPGQAAARRGGRA